MEINSVLSVERVEVLLIISAIVALAARRLRMPYTVGLVVAGTALASIGVLQGFPLTKELIFRAFLPPLIFEAAFFIRWKELKENLVPVLILASIGVVVAAVVIAPAMVLLGGWTWPVAILFGTLIAATDPVSVIAMFKELKVEGRLRLLVEAESLFNDGVAAVLFSVALLYAGGTELTLSLSGMTLLTEVGGGLASGAAVAAAVLFLAGRTDDHLVELTFTTVAAFGAFLLAEHFHSSGVLAVLVAGLAIGNLGHIGAITDQGREAVGAFWEFVAFIANSFVFLLIGVREHAIASLLIQHIDLIALAIVTSLVGRAIAVYGVTGLFSRSKHKIEGRHKHVLVWGGLKGALSLALAIGLPEDMPFREQVVAVTFGVVAFSVIVQGMTMPLLMRRLGLIGARA
ncbi:cation:proton antiporter [soil metagenome]